MLGKLWAGDVLVVRWLDRLGHNYDDVRDTIASDGEEEAGKGKDL
jgi:hypothetical protein